MLGTYACLLLALGASAVVGQAIFAACGRRRWTWLAPAVGLAALCPLAWWTVRLPGESTPALIVGGLAVLAAAAVCLRGRVEVSREAFVDGLALALGAALLASLPFLVEGRFGILGTGLNPDMSQHLFAADRLAAGGSERLISEGYPLGPHALAVALGGLGPSFVHAFGGLTIATAVAACLAPLELLGGLGRRRRLGAALCVGFAYLAAAYLVQGAFKETMQALFLLGFAIGLEQIAAGAGEGQGPRARLLSAVPLAVLALGSVYAYSFPGLAWIVGALGLWALIELATRARRSGPAAALAAARMAAGPALVAAGVLVAGVAPELGRIVEFAGFETFNPDGEGLGNLFDRLSPLEALGIWPSGDFRVEPGGGAVPALLFYASAVVGIGALGFGLVWWWRRGERAVPAAFGAAALLWLVSLLAGTPYQEAKALVLAAPLVALISVRALVAAAPAPLTVAFLLAAAGSSALALANGQVGPGGYSPELAELRGQLGKGSYVVFAPPELLDRQHGRDYLAWELRGNRICVERKGTVNEPPPGAASIAVRIDDDGAVVPELVYESGGPSRPGPCPLIPDGARADPSAAAERG